MAEEDPRRRIPRTDHLLVDPAIVAAAAPIGQTVLNRIIKEVQQLARQGTITPEAVKEEILAVLGTTRANSFTPVLNATGVIIHTNLGRAPLSDAARQALDQAAGYIDLELDLDTGVRSRRAAGARSALLQACPAAEDALVVNNGAAALLLATTVLAGPAEVIISRGELIEIGAGFRLPELISSTGTTLKEIGATNRTHFSDYQAAVDSNTGAILKVHPSNFRISGFTSSVSTQVLAQLCHEHGLPLIVDVGSGLLAPEPVLPEEPDMTSALAAGADVVIASGDKLLGGPQAGILLGKAEMIAALARHPLARALRADKLTLAALEATLKTDQIPVTQALHADSQTLRERAMALAQQLQTATGNSYPVVEHDGRVGGGGGVDVPLQGYAVQLPEKLARPLRLGQPAVLPRVHEGACLLDLRCIPPEADESLVSAVVGALGQR